MATIRISPSHTNIKKCGKDSNLKEPLRLTTTPHVTDPLLECDRMSRIKIPDMRFGNTKLSGNSLNKFLSITTIGIRVFVFVVLRPLVSKKLSSCVVAVQQNVRCKDTRHKYCVILQNRCTKKTSLKVLEVAVTNRWVHGAFDPALKFGRWRTSSTVL